MRKTITAGTVLAIGLCSVSSVHLASAKPKQENAKVKTASQAANIARLHYINGRRSIRYDGKPETIVNWKNPKIWRSRSKQNNSLWNVHFIVPHKPGVIPTDDFTVTMGENGKVVYIIQANN